MKKNSHPIMRRSIALLMSLALIIGLFPATVAYAIGDDTLTVKEKTTAAKGTETTQDGVVFKTIYGEKVSEDAGRMTFGGLRYWVYLPENYDALKEYPMVVFMHGSHLSYKRAGDMTPWTDTLNRNSSGRNYKIADKLHDVLGDYILFVPQVPGTDAAQGLVPGSTWTMMEGKNWASATQEQLNSAESDPTDYLLAAENMINGYITSGVAYDAQETYKVDDNRVYLIGDSMGAIGSYAMLEDCPTTFAAAIIRAGMGRTTDLTWSKTTPVVVAHGTNDVQVPYARCQDMLTALEAAGAKDVQKFLVEGAPHEIRQELYNASTDGGQTYTYMTWLAQQSRSDYVIDSYEDYDNLRKAVNSGNADALTYVSNVVGKTIATAAEAAALDVSLEADITISTPGVGIGTSANKFTGNFDGNGHTVTFNVTTGGASLVNTSLLGIATGTVRNVKLAGSISYTDSALVLGKGTALTGGGLVRTAPLALQMSGAAALVENVVSDVDLTYQDTGAPATAGKFVSIAGLVGFNEGNTLDCTVSGDITVTLNVVENLYLGGIVQQAQKIMKNVKHTGSITVTDNTTAGSELRVGGIGALVGGGVLDATGVENSGDITVNSKIKYVYVGGIVGEVRVGPANLTDCSNTGDITATSAGVYMGSITGWFGLDNANYSPAANVINFTNTGNVNATVLQSTKTGIAAVGGLIGRAQRGALKIKDTVSKTGTVQISSGTAQTPLTNLVYGYCGGVIGYGLATAEVEMTNVLVSTVVKVLCNSSNTGSKQWACGFVGVSQGTNNLTECFFNGGVARGTGVPTYTAHYGIVGGTNTFVDCGHGSAAGNPLVDGVGKLTVANIPAEGVVSLHGVSLTEGENPIWAGTTPPKALGFTGDGVSLNDEGRLCFAKDGNIEVTATWNGIAVGKTTVTVAVCAHTYGAWEHTGVDQHSQTCIQCGDVQKAAHSYTAGVCECGRTESGDHVCDFVTEEILESNDLTHYNCCNWPGCPEIRNEAAHTYVNGECSVCGRSAVFSDEGRVYEIASAADYANLLNAVNNGDAAAMVAVAQKLAGDKYVEGMTVTQTYAAALDVKQTADIVLTYTGAAGETKPVGIGTSEVPFRGDYDGNGKTITFQNIALSGAAVENVGLFGYVTGDITNVKLAGSISYNDSQYLMDMQYIAPLATYPTGGVIANCTSDVDVTYENAWADAPNSSAELSIYGLIGLNKAASVNNCKVTGDVTVTNKNAMILNVGGVSGQLYLVFENVEYSGKITVNDTRASHLYIGGVSTEGSISNNDGCSIKNLTNKGDIDITATGRAVDDSRLAMVFTGGVVAQNANTTTKTWTMENCVNEGNITVNGGHSDGTKADGTILKDNVYAGGILGHSQKDNITMVDCVNNGDIKVIHNGVGENRSYYHARLGGFMGSHNCSGGETVTLQNCINNGDIRVENVEGAYWRSETAQHVDAGGFIGEMNVNSKFVFRNCVNNGNVSSARTENIFLGGFLGDARGNITATNVTNNGDVWTEDATYTTCYVGGFAGLSRKNLSVTEFVNTGDITASLKGSDNTGDVTAAAGGVLGNGGYYSATPTILLDKITIGGTVTAKTNEKESGYAGYAIGRINVGTYTSDAVFITVNYYRPTAVLTNEQAAVHEDQLGMQAASVKDANIQVTLLGTPKDEQVVTASNVTATMGDTGVKVAATTNGDGALSYAVTSGDDVVSVDAAGNLTLLKAGTAKIRVTAAETETYKEATVDVIVTVQLAEQVVTAANVSANLGDTGMKISATTNGDGALSYTITSGDDVVYVYGEGNLAFLKVGTAVVRVSAAATNAYKAAYVDVTITVREKAPSGGGGIVYVDPYYTLSFVTNGGSFINSVSDVIDTKIDLSKYVPVRDGYSFAGWYSDSALTMAVTSVQLRNNMTVYAKWAGLMPFTDIEKDHQFYAPIQWAYTNGYMIGKTATTFDRVSSVTRQQVWRVLARVVKGEDVADMAAAKVWAVQNGVSDGTRPGAAATREDMVTMLWIACGKPAPANRSILNSFPDAGDVSAKCVDAMAWAVENGIIQGTLLKTLNPKGETTRGAFTAILYRYCTK